MLNKREILESIIAMKNGVASAVGKERAEIFIGRNIEVLIACLLEGKTEAETIALCKFS